jgi:ubiquinone/menaquinone biosynthesis C-methylase UbiE
MVHSGRADWEDPERIQSLIDSYSQRYGDKFWKPFLALTGSKQRRTIADFGCGPGLFLVDAVKHYKASKVFGFDMSTNMLIYARHFLQNVLNSDAFVLEEVNFDTNEIPLRDNSIDLGFSGYLLHEVRNPQKFVTRIQQLIQTNGIYVVFDFISDNPEAFEDIMVKQGKSRVKARKRYHSMCKHSLPDILKIYRSAGFSKIKYKQIDETRIIVKGIKA